MKNIWKVFTLYLPIICSGFLFGCKSTKSTTASDSIYFYVGTNSGDPEEGIYTFKIDLESGKSEFVSKYPNILNPGYLAITDDKKKLYAVHGIKGEKESYVSAFTINKNNGALEFLNNRSTNGRGGCHVSTTAEGDVVVANYSSGSVSLLPTIENGNLTPAASTIEHTGSSINKERQNGPHAHFIQQGIGDLFYAVDLGIDKIMLYKKVNDQLVANDPPSINIHPGAGPRHVDFHPNEKFVYVLNELEGSVSVLKYMGNDQGFETIQTITTLPEDFSGFNKSADIHIHPSGTFLYASNRGDHNSVAAYRIDGSSGMLTLIEIEAEAVAWPRNFAISSSGDYLLCANRDSDSITFYDIDQDNGTLRFNGNKVDAPKPICVKFGGS